MAKGMGIEEEGVVVMALEEEEAKGMEMEEEGVRAGNASAPWNRGQDTSTRS